MHRSEFVPSYANALDTRPRIISSDVSYLQVNSFAYFINIVIEQNGFINNYNLYSRFGLVSEKDEVLVLMYAVDVINRTPSDHKIFDM